MKFYYSPTLYKVIHQLFATDRYHYGSTVVEASSREDAMKKLNDYLATKPDGVYSALPCEGIEDVHPLPILG